MAPTKTIPNLLVNLKYTKTISYFYTNNETSNKKEIHIEVAPNEEKACLCPKCLIKCPRYDKKRSVKSSWRANNYNDIPVYLEYQPTRIKCKEHGVLTEYLPWSDGKSRFLEEFNNEVAFMATNISRSSTAEYFGINWRTVGNCIKAAHQRLEPKVSLRIHSGLKRICVDEVDYNKGHKYITVIYDLDKNQVAWAHEGHGEKVFSQFCDQLTKKERSEIEIVVSDGRKWLDSCVSKFFINANNCLDPFYLVKWANEAVDSVRITTIRKISYEYRQTKCKDKEGPINNLDNQEETIKIIKDSKSLLCNDLENKETTLSLIQSNFPYLYKAYELKESLKTIIHISNEELVSEELIKWIDESKNCQIKPMIELAEKINRYLFNIINSFKYTVDSSLSKTACETITTLIKIAKGYRNIDNLKVMIYLSCSSLVASLKKTLPDETMTSKTVK